MRAVVYSLDIGEKAKDRLCTYIFLNLFTENYNIDNACRTKNST